MRWSGGIVDSTALRDLAASEDIDEVVVGDINTERTNYLIKSIGSDRVRALHVGVTDKTSTTWPTPRGCILYGIQLSTRGKVKRKWVVPPEVAFDPRDIMDELSKRKVSDPEGFS